MHHVGEVLQRGPPVRRLRQGTRRIPLVRRRKSTRAVARPGRGAPLLVTAGPAGVQLDLGAVGGGRADGVETQPGLDTGDRAVGVDVPLLVGAAVAVPDDHRGAVGGALVLGVQALVAVDLQLLAVGVGPTLVGLSAAGPQLGLGAVGGGGDGDVDTAAGGHALDLSRTGTVGRLARGGTRAGAEGVHDGGVGGLGFAVVVEQQGAVAAAPGVAVTDAPYRDAGAPGHGQAGFDRVGVVGGRRPGDVQFGDLDVNAQGGEVGQGGLEAGRRAADAEVALEPDAVDRHAAGLEVLDHAVDALGLGVRPVLDVVVVVAELGRGVGRPGGAERFLDEAVAQHVLEHRAAVLGGAVGERLVDHVPGVDLALVVGHLGGDVVVHHAAQRGGVGDAADPRGQLGVPHQGVPAQPLPVGGRVADDPVGGAEVEIAAGRFDGVPLHFVLRGDHVEFPVQDRGVRRVAEPAGGHSGAEVPARGGRLRTQGCGSGGAGEERQDTGQQRRGRQSYRQCSATPAEPVQALHDSPRGSRVTLGAVIVRASAVTA